MHPASRVGTEYHGPVVVTVLEFGGRSIRLVRPTEPDRMLDETAVHDWNRRDDYMPYWAYLWPAAYLLAEAVSRENWPEGTEVLEIGCGLGLAGLTGLACGLHVQFSDYDPAPLEFIARSASENGFDASRFTTRLLDWRHPPDETFPVILGADVIYEARLVPLVARLLGKMLAPGGLGLIASPYRVPAEAFPAAVESVGLVCRVEPATARGEDGQTMPGTIYGINRLDSTSACR
jgi:predicted nicotinamide N-methyase